MLDQAHSERKKQKRHIDLFSPKRYQDSWGLDECSKRTQTQVIVYVALIGRIRLA